MNGKRRRLALVGNGIDFLGYIVRRDYLLARRRVVGNLRARLAWFEKRLVRRNGEVSRAGFDRPTLDGLAASLSSYLDCRQANCHRLVQAIWRRFAYLAEYFDLDNASWKLGRRYEAPAGFTNVRGQYGFFRQRFAGDALFFQVGSFFEFYHPGDEKIATLLRLAPMAPNRRGALFGFPVRLFDRHRDKLLSKGWAVTVVREWHWRWTSIKERTVAARYRGRGAK